MIIVMIALAAGVFVAAATASAAGLPAVYCIGTIGSWGGIATISIYPDEGDDQIKGLGSYAKGGERVSSIPLIGQMSVNGAILWRPDNTVFYDGVKIIDGRFVGTWHDPENSQSAPADLPCSPQNARHQSAP